MNTKQTNEFDNFVDALVDELIATPDDQVLEGLDPAAVQANGLRLLQAAKAKVSRSRLAAAKAGYSAMKAKPATAPMNVSPEEARRFIAQAANDGRFTMAARNLGELSDEEAISLYTKLRTVESAGDGDAK